jgi:cytochrome P450 family 4
MGVKVNDDNVAHNYVSNLQFAVETVFERMIKPWFHFDIIYNLFGSKKVLDKSVETIKEYCRTIIDERRKLIDLNANEVPQVKQTRFAILDILLDARQSGLIDDEGIFEESNTLMAAGHDTLSLLFAFTLLVLSHDTETQNKMYEEINQYVERNGEVTIEKLNNLQLMDRVIKETLRIYPTVPAFMRTLKEDVVMGEWQKLMIRLIGLIFIFSTQMM